MWETKGLGQQKTPSIFFGSGYHDAKRAEACAAPSIPLVSLLSKSLFRSLFLLSHPLPRLLPPKIEEESALSRRWSVASCRLTQPTGHPVVPRGAHRSFHMTGVTHLTWPNGFEKFWWTITGEYIHLLMNKRRQAPKRENWSSNVCKTAGTKLNQYFQGLFPRAHTLLNRDGRPKRKGDMTRGLATQEDSERWRQRTHIHKQWTLTFLRAQEAAASTSMRSAGGSGRNGRSIGGRSTHRNDAENWRSSRLSEEWQMRSTEIFSWRS